MREYVLLFPFTKHGDVILMQVPDDHPIPALRGRWNGWGGKVEAGETFEEAAAREGDEELPWGKTAWRRAGIFGNCHPKHPDPWRVCVFVAGPTDGVVSAEAPKGSAVMAVRHVWGNRVVPNLRWLLPMAHSVWDAGADCWVRTFDVTEAS